MSGQPETRSPPAGLRKLRYLDSYRRKYFWVISTEVVRWHAATLGVIGGPNGRIDTDSGSDTSSPLKATENRAKRFNSNGRWTVRA